MSLRTVPTTRPRPCSARWTKPARAVQRSFSSARRTPADAATLSWQVKSITDRYSVPLIIDDRVDVAIACDAAGVHVGASDLPVAVCRRLLGPDKIVGATAKTVEAAVAAYNDGADYLGTGAIYPTTTHVTTKVTPVSVLNDVCRAVPIPVVAIGGLNADNMDVLADSPIKGIAVVSAVMKAEDPCAAAAHIKEKFLKMMNK